MQHSYTKLRLSCVMLLYSCTWPVPSVSNSRMERRGSSRGTPGKASGLISPSCFICARMAWKSYGLCILPRRRSSAARQRSPTSTTNLHGETLCAGLQVEPK